MNIDSASSPPVTAARRPGLGFVLRHPAHFIACGAGVGLLRPGPGTWGTLAAWLLFGLLETRLAPLELLLILPPLYLVGIWACQVTGRALGRPDHPAMVWDEMVAFLLVLALVPPDTLWRGAAFALFRAFDIAKPQPIRHFEARHPDGWGVMLDDLLAAFYTLLVLAAWKALL